MAKQQVSLRDANQHLSRYVAAVEKGGEILITRRGKPVARHIKLLVNAIDTADRDKHQAAHRLLDTLVEQDTVVSVQALAEFFHVVTRKGRLSTEEARDRIGDWQALFPVIAAGPNTLSHAIDGLRRFQMPLWDAMLRRKPA